MNHVGEWVSALGLVVSVAGFSATLTQVRKAVRVSKAIELSSKDAWQRSIHSWIRLLVELEVELSYAIRSEAPGTISIVLGIHTRVAQKVLRGIAWQDLGSPLFEQAFRDIITSALVAKDALYQDEFADCRVLLGEVLIGWARLRPEIEEIMAQFDQLASVGGHAGHGGGNQ